MRRFSDASLVGLLFLALITFFWIAVSPSKGLTLVKAASVGDTNTLRQLVDGGVDVNWCTKLKRRTALMAASGAGQIGAVRFLLTHGADKKLKDASGRTAHDYAIENGCTNVAPLLE